MREMCFLALLGKKSLNFLAKRVLSNISDIKDIFFPSKL
jgi:hypothetical protein